MAFPKKPIPEGDPALNEEILIKLPEVDPFDDLPGHTEAPSVKAIQEAPPPEAVGQASLDLGEAVNSDSLLGSVSAESPNTEAVIAISPPERDLSSEFEPVIHDDEPALPVHPDDWHDPENAVQWNRPPRREEPVDDVINVEETNANAEHPVPAYVSQPTSRAANEAFGAGALTTYAASSAAQEAIPDFASRSANNLLDFGKFARLERDVQKAVLKIDQPAGNSTYHNAFINQFRQSLHRAVLTNPAAAQPGKESLEARSKVLNDTKAEFDNWYAQQFGGLEEADAQLPRDYHKAVSSLMEAENKRLSEMLSLTQASPDQMTGGVAFVNLVAAGIASPFTLAKKLAPSFDRSLSGDLLTKRNQAINDRLHHLADIAAEMKGGVGNQQWEETKGMALSKEARKAFRQVSRMMSPYATQADHNGFNERAKAIKEQLDDVKGKAVTEAFKESLDRLVKAFMNLIDRVMEKVGLRKPNSDVRPGLQPSRPSPM